MKKICLLLVFVLSISMFGCRGDTYHWEFNYSCEEINQIKIIEFIDDMEFREVKELDLELSCEIYDSITKLTMRRYGTNLSTPSGKCFLIVFNSGEYDIISQKESKHFKYNGEEILEYNSWLYFEKSEFDELINKYLYLNNT